MSIERMEGVPNPLIVQWIRKLSKIIRQKLSEATIPQNAKEIQVLELDELFTYCKKLDKVYIWLAVDRVRNQVVDLEVTTSRDFNAIFHCL
jgi:hypothetical protein